MTRGQDPRIAALCERAERLARHLDAQRMQIAALRHRLSPADDETQGFTLDITWR